MSQPESTKEKASPFMGAYAVQFLYSKHNHRQYGKSRVKKKEKEKKNTYSKILKSCFRGVRIHGTSFSK